LVFPNPSAGNFTIQITELPLQVSAIEVYNAVGQKIFEQSIPNMHEKEYAIDVSCNPNGLYYLLIKTPATVITKRIIIHH
jgi:hypothetical protein